MKTIGLTDAHERVLRLLPRKIPIDKKALEPLADARNGVAHSAIHDSAQAEAVITICLCLVDPVLEELTVHPNGYWGPYRVLHDNLVDEQVREERVAAEALLVKTRSMFERHFGHMARKERDVVLAATTSQPMITMSREVPKQCPACGSQGWVAGEANVQGIAVHCAACDLEVDSKLLFHLGDLDEDVVLDDDPHHYVDEPPVDEDIYKGR
ncbi:MULTISPECIES: hypothetical protein [unclassified Streptomyces]|uniref:hypothetical protein n=1 Tax=unclassified Streptomyces TaxID=2593676 RepID=UPI001F071D4F|nr:MULTISPECIES: hypothetical protein [unclassified Streptomyces]